MMHCATTRCGLWQYREIGSFPPCNLTGLQLNMQAVIDQNVITWYTAVQALLSAFKWEAETQSG